MLTLLATVLAVAAPMTGDATEITATGATLNGTVDTPGTAHFEYGTSTGYGLTTPSQPVTAGAVSAAVTGLTPNTTYHFKLVSNGDDGGDKTFRSAPNPTPPGVADQRSSAVTTGTAHLSASLDPNGAETTYYFQYGRSTSYGTRTKRITVPAGAEPITVEADLTGLRPYTRYHWRLFARNAAGNAGGRDRTFRTARLASSVTLFSSRKTVQWGKGVMLGGRVTGAGVNQMTLALERQQFPFDGAFTEVHTTHAGEDGGYLFSVDHVWAATRYRVVSRTQEPVTSAVALVRAKPRARIAARLVSRKRARVTGTIKPAITGELSLQRKLASGGWAQVRHHALAASTQYAFKVTRARTVNRAYRVVVLPVRGAYAKAKSRAVVVSRRPARARGSRAAAG
jgi:hypothetical protein